jgi:hypothetical protein
MDFIFIYDIFEPVLKIDDAWRAAAAWLAGSWEAAPHFWRQSLGGSGVPSWLSLRARWLPLDMPH